jgi:hypothetical protein
MPDESTIRKLTRRLGPEVIDEITRLVIGRELRERRFVARAMRVDSTVVEADVRYPNDAALATDGTRVLAREPRKLVGLAGTGARGVTDRSRSAGRKLREISRTVARRTGEAKTTVLRLTGEAGELITRSVREARRLATRLRARARGRGAQAKLSAARRLDELADLAEKIARQIEQRLAGDKITDRLVSMFDPDARPIRKGKLRAPTELGYVVQFAENTENTRRGARGLLLPAATRLGNPTEDTLLTQTAHELTRLALTPRDVALDAGFNPGPTAATLPTASASSSPPASPPARATATAAWPATASAAKAASATSSADTAPAAAGSKAKTAPEPRSAGASWPTTSTPRHPDRLKSSRPLPDLHPGSRFAPRPRRPARPCSFSSPPFYPGEVAKPLTEQREGAFKRTRPV